MTDSDYQAGHSDNDHVRVSYQFGDAKMEAEGPTEFVNQHTAVFLSAVNSVGEIVPTIHLGEKGSTPLLGDNGVSEKPSGGKNGQKPQDLEQFYHKLNPKGQINEILVITYFYQKYEDYECLVLADYEQAYQALKRLAVKAPGNYDSSVRAVCNRTDLLYVQKGQFRLTRQGEEHIEAIMQSQG